LSKYGDFQEKKNPENLAVMVHFLFPQRMNPLYGFSFYLTFIGLERS